MLIDIKTANSWVMVAVEVCTIPNVIICEAENERVALPQHRRGQLELLALEDD